MAPCVGLTVFIVGAIGPAQPLENGPTREALREAVQDLDDARPWLTAVCLLHVAELYQKLGDAKEAANVMDKMRGNQSTMAELAL